MSTLFLCGAGNSEGVRLAQRINEATGDFDRILLLDDDTAKHGEQRLGVEIVGGFDTLATADPTVDRVVNLVARTTRGRRGARSKIASFGVPFAPLIHPNVDTAGATIPDDIIVYQNATIGPEVVLGSGTVVFMGAIAGHESTVGECCVLASNSVLNARVVLGEGVYVGTNATVLPEMTIGADANIGAGSTVMTNVPPGASAIGVPAEVMSTHGGRASSHIDPRALETTIARAWADALGRPTIGRHTNFFDLGATSLLAMQVRERLAHEIGCTIAPTDLYRFPSVAALVGHLAEDSGSRAGPRAGRLRAAARRRARAGM